MCKVLTCILENQAKVLKSITETKGACTFMKKSVMSVLWEQDITFSLTWALHSFFISSSIFSSLSVSFCFSSSFVSSSFCLLCIAVSFSHTWTVFCFSRSSSVLQRTRAFYERTEPLLSIYPTTLNQLKLLHHIKQSITSCFFSNTLSLTCWGLVLFDGFVYSFLTGCSTTMYLYSLLTMYTYLRLLEFTL